MVKILIAEDDVVTQKMVSSVVEDMGYVAIISPNGKHAYETLKANEDINLLITDIMMPEMDGKQLIQTLRGDTGFKDLPIIIMSAVVGIKQIAGLMDLGASMFQPKPLDMNELKMNITSCLEYEEKKKTVKPV
jgi:CheY-like chemotaxis protein